MSTGGAKGERAEMMYYVNPGGMDGWLRFWGYVNLGISWRVRVAEGMETLGRDLCGSVPHILEIWRLESIGCQTMTA